MIYKTVNEHYREKFGCKVYKLSVDAGFTCPNRDGTLGNKGCIFCSNGGSGEFAEKGDDIVLQLENAKQRVCNKNKSGKYIAYFQAFTNTYAEPEVLRKLYSSAVSPEYIVGISVATRPDCLNDAVISVLSEINKIKPVSVELGLQTVHDETAEYIRRGYKIEVYYSAVKRLKSAGLEVVTHIILGLPNESEEMMVETARLVSMCGSDGVKFHILYVLKGTDLEKDYTEGKFKCLTLEEYASVLKKSLLALKEGTVVHRITGDGAKKDLTAPLWTADKKRVMNYLVKYLSND